ncbi:hypothetical protein GA0070622_1205 [Micromonospora sediminicola]|uniref:Uncharacterized protein n=1 Tax=Micromonospora sediminicola TaxID=946078 RepID=A0A1A9B417_9ACTN|nr:hypothetical protein [Micromonospora sediminicola]SBT64235.1 hypothetical protein GA0070622_1205 [Micromonospora sediminicola]
MSRTPEQVAADEALTAAIEQALLAYGPGDQAYILTEYVVVTSQQRFDEEGNGITAVGCINRDSDVPFHRILGLLEYAGTRTRRRIATDDEED